MGLDMYVVRVHNQQVIDDFTIRKGAERNDVWYQRKNNSVHGWMENLYRQKGGAEESFNCVYVRLTEDDILRLRADIVAGNVKPVEGYFFGEQVFTEEERAATLNFCEAALNTYLKDDHSLYYYSWW